MRTKKDYPMIYSTIKVADAVEKRTGVFAGVGYIFECHRGKDIAAVV